MRPLKFIHQLAVRFSEMDQSEADEIYADGKADYDKMLLQAKTKLVSNQARLQELHEVSAGKRDKENVRKEVKLSPVDNLVLKGEHWLTRYGFAMVYIVIMPMIRKYMNGETDTEEGADNDMEFFRMYQAFKNMKKS